MLAAGKRIYSSIKAYYKEINTATLSGANDVVVVEQPDGTLVSSPFSVRFGKLGVMRYNATEIYIDVNGEPCDLKMVLSNEGEAFFPSTSTDDSELLDLCGAEQKPESSASIEDSVTGHAHLVRVFSDSDLYTARKGRDCDAESGGSSSSSTVTPHGGVFAMELLDVDTDASPLHAQSLTERKDLAAASAAQRHHATASSQPRQRHVTGEETSSSGRALVAPSLVHLACRDESCRWPSADQQPACSPAVEVAASAAMLRPADQDCDAADHWLPQSSTSPPSQLSRSWHSSTSLPTQQQQQQQHRDGHVLGTSLRGQADGAASGGALPPVTAVTCGPHPSAAAGAATLAVPAEHRHHRSSEQGVYLDDLDRANHTSEEVELYFAKRSNVTAPLAVQCGPNFAIGVPEEECESGQGTLSPRSPAFAVELTASPAGSGFQLSRASSPLSDVDSGSAERDGSPCPLFGGGVSLSLCGGAKDGGSISMDRFHQHLVTFEDFCKDPCIIDNPNLVVRLQGRLMNWKVASAVALATAAYHCPPPSEVIDALIKQHMPPPKTEERKKGLFSWWSRTRSDVAVVKQETGSPSLAEGTAVTAAGGSTAAHLPAALAAASATASCGSVGTAAASAARKVSPDAEAALASLDAAAAESHPTTTVSNATGKNEGSEGEAYLAESRPTKLPMLNTIKQRRKTPTSEQLTQLRLQPGRNDIEFSVTTALQGTTRCTSSVYLWKWTDRIVVSDIDGTITRSDVLGQLLPMVGKDWSQVDVAKLYTKMTENGYKFVYLSARAIGQSQMTRDFLSSVRQHQLTLPPGPLFLSPTSLYTAFHKEVIERKPEEFKISCLRSLKALFPSTVPCPLYAGFGNKINDVWAYRAVDIPASRVFTINTKGELRNEVSQAFQSSYSKLSDVVDHFFPPVKTCPAVGRGGDGAEYIHESSDFSSFAYWREPLPVLPQPSVMHPPAVLTGSALALPLGGGGVAAARGTAGARTVETRAGA